MIDFETQFFQRMRFTAGQLGQYLASAQRDHQIATGDDIPEVKFKFAYDALIKLGISLLAHEGYKVRSQPGHHVKIIAKLSAILGDEEIEIIGNVMRQRRNKDFYEGGTIITETEAKQYVEFVAKAEKQVVNYMNL